MKTKMNVRWGLCLVLLLATSTFNYAQSSQGNPKDDEDIVSSIASYPSDVRDAILNIAQYPRKIVKLERVQSRTSQEFQDLVSGYPREEQMNFYELSRYPDLVHQLAQEDRPSLSNYPKETADAVTELYPKYLSDLKSMDKMYQSSQKSLYKITEDLPVDVQADFKKVVAKPDVMNLLTEQIDQVVKLGEAYKDDPKGTKEKLDELNAQITAQNQKDLADYKNKVASDPKMQDEMKKSAQEFASSNNQQPTVVNNYYGYNSNPYWGYNPYPYWFGYPYWYSYAMWYPMPLYYYTGFYLGMGGSVVVVGLPSRTYSGWFFNYGYRYPRYYGYCNTYYSAHRTYVTNLNVYRNFNTTVNNRFSRTSNRMITRDVNVNRNSFHSRMSGNSRMNSGTTHNNFRQSLNQPNSNHHLNSNLHQYQPHQQNWNMRGGSTFGGGSRMGGVSGGFGGGGHFGGGHGRR